MPSRPGAKLFLSFCRPTYAPPFGGRQGQSRADPVPVPLLGRFAPFRLGVEFKMHGSGLARDVPGWAQAVATFLDCKNLALIRG